MMKLSRAEVEHIAKLARLVLTEDEIGRYQEQLSDILDLAARLQEVDTGDIPPTASVLPPRSVLRKDEPGETFTHEQLFQNAPDVEKQQFRVPPILGDES